MFMIVGLGNPGQQYKDTRHNVGFMALDYFARKNNLHFTKSKWTAMTAKALLWDVSVLLLKPETFMNASGIAVAGAARFHKILPERILVIHDDLDIEFGRLKIASSGGDGGHKGIRSIIEHLDTKNFPRLKIGIGRPAPPVLPEKYVLGKFEPDQIAGIDRKLAAVSDGIRIYLRQGISAAMTVVNRKD